VGSARGVLTGGEEGRKYRTTWGPDLGGVYVTWRKRTRDVQRYFRVTVGTTSRRPAGEKEGKGGVEKTGCRQREFANTNERETFQSGN